jgi:N-acetylmuramoyl-L-alanine amidase
MRAIFSCFTLLCMLLWWPVAAHAMGAIKLFLDGKELVPEVAPVIVEGNTLVPVRIIAENLGADVRWDGDNRKVTVEHGNVKLEMTIDRTQVKVNDAEKMLEVPPMLIDGNTMLPVRFVSEQLGMQVAWDGRTNSVFLYAEQAAFGDAAAGAGTNDKGNESGGGNAAGGNAIGGGNSPGGDGMANAGRNAAGTGNPSEGTADQSGGSKGSTDRTSATPADPGSAKTGSEPTEGSGVGAPADAKAGEVRQGASSGNAAPTNSSAPLGGTTSGVAAPANPPSHSPSNVDKSNGDKSDGNKAQEPSNAPKRADDPNIPNVQSVRLIGDRIYIQASEKLKANVLYLRDPDRLVIDLPNSELDATMNGQPVRQNGEIAVDSPYVAKIRYALFADKPPTVRIVLDLKTKAEAAVLETNFPNQTVLQLKTPKYTIVLDAGHGGHDSGAVSATGRFEKDFNLSMVNKIKKLLEQEPQIQVLTTRSDDTFLELDERVEFANSRKADLFVSVHGNYYTSKLSGSETYYYREESKPLADLVHSYVVQATGFPDRGVRKEKFRVVTTTAMPAVLLEIGYLSNPGDEVQMYSEPFQDRVARAIVAALKDYLKIR